tara:strand:- start:546 stop:1457 length:912 start_codon:yes stop_codon:yes gene_type:complete
MPNCKKPIKKPNFKDFCMDIDTDKLYMTEMPVKFSGKWKEACRKNISGKDRGISLLNKHERSWIKPKDISKKKWNAMSAKKKGKFMKQLWEKQIKEYQICAAQESYKKGRDSYYEDLNKLNKQPTPPPLPPSLSKKDLREIGINIDDTPPPPPPSTSDLPPPPPPFPTELLPPPPSRKTKSKKPKKPSPRKTKKLYLNKKPNLSPNSRKIWGNYVPSPHTPKGIPPPRTPNDSPDNWDEYGPDKHTPLKLPKGLGEALRRAVGKGSRKKRKRRRKNSTQKAKKKKTQKGKKKKNKKKSKKSKK